MEAVNGGGEEKGGPPPPSPLTGCYLLIVIGEPHSKDHKDIILQRVAKGLLSWDRTDCLVDLEKELTVIFDQGLEGEEARYGERLIQYASENLVTEILIHPAVSTLSQCVRNLLSSFTRHRHIIHAGYTFQGNGSWALQDGTFSYSDFAEAFQEIEVQRVIRAYENGISLDLHCAPEGDWSRLSKESFSKACKVRVNPTDVLTTGSSSISKFIKYLEPFLVPTSLETILESSDVVGNIRFSRPTLYVFPGGQGDAALFGINGFNMLLDGGYSRKACFWDFVRHLDRLDAVLMTRLNNSSANGIGSVLRRKRQDAMYPQVGHFFCNIQERKSPLSPDGDKDKDPLIISLLEQGHGIYQDLKHLNLTPQPCYRDSDPIILYHKVGHGTLNMFVLSPDKNSREVREFMQKWNQTDPKLFAGSKSGKDFTFPLQNLVSICALLIWQPANPDDTITRILYPGSTPQKKIFEGLDRLKSLEYIKHPVCTEKSVAPSKKTKQDVLDRISTREKIEKKSENKMLIEDAMKNGVSNGEITKEKQVKKSDSVESEKEKRGKKAEEVKKIEDLAKVVENGDKVKPRAKIEPKITKRSDSTQRKKPIVDKKGPTTPKKTIENKTNGEALKDKKPPNKPSPSATPAKSTKDANNRKVIESKKAPPKKDQPPKPAPPTTDTKAKPERKPISRRPKTIKAPLSPLKKMTNGVQKPDSLTKRGKLDKEGTTDSSTVSTPSADQESVLKKDISKLTPEEIQQLKEKELEELQEEQEAIKEIEAVFRKGEVRAGEADPGLRKIKDISIEDKLEAEEYLIIEKEEVERDSLDQEAKEDEMQKLTRDSEESEKQRKLSAEEKEINITKEQEKPKPVEPKEDVSKKPLIPSSEEKPAPGPEEENKESHPEEKVSANVESGATTTAPTLPEDERITLDEIKEDNGHPIEEKHVKEETKEKEVPVIQLPPKSQQDSTSKLPGVAGITLDKQRHVKDIIKTPDEVADLPVHEEADYHEFHVDEKKSNEVELGKSLVKEEKEKELTVDGTERGEKEMGRTEKGAKEDQPETTVDGTERGEKEMERTEKGAKEDQPETHKDGFGEPKDVTNDVDNIVAHEEDKLDAKESVGFKKVDQQSDVAKPNEIDNKQVKTITDTKTKTHSFLEQEIIASQEVSSKDSKSKEAIIKSEEKSYILEKSELETKEKGDTEKVEDIDEDWVVVDKSKEGFKPEEHILEDPDVKLPKTDTAHHDIELIKESATVEEDKEDVCKTKEDQLIEKESDSGEKDDHEIRREDEIHEAIEKEEENIQTLIDEAEQQALRDEKINTDKDSIQQVLDPATKTLELLEEKKQQDDIKEEKKDVGKPVTEAIEEDDVEKHDPEIRSEDEIHEILEKEKEDVASLIKEADQKEAIRKEDPCQIGNVSSDSKLEEKINEKEDMGLVAKKEDLDLVKPDSTKVDELRDKILEDDREECNQKHPKLFQEKGRGMESSEHAEQLQINELDDKLREHKETVDQTKNIVEQSYMIQEHEDHLHDKELKDDLNSMTKIDVKLQGLKTDQKEIKIEQSNETPEHAEQVVLSDSSPEDDELRILKELDINKAELGRKSPAEREEDVIKIVTSVAVVLKSEAPLEEFQGKIPFTQELRETHITTQDPSNDIPTIPEEPVLDEQQKDIKDKRKDLLADAQDLIAASSKVISDIKGKNVNESETEEDTGTVHRMLVTASSEDGGEEIEICPPGTITFSRSSESSGRSSPEPSQKTQSHKSSMVETSSDTTSTVKKIPIEKEEKTDGRAKETFDDSTKHTSVASEGVLEDKAESSILDILKSADKMGSKIEKKIEDAKEQALNQLQDIADKIDNDDTVTKAFDTVKEAKENAGSSVKNIKDDFKKLEDGIKGASDDVVEAKNDLDKSMESAKKNFEKKIDSVKEESSNILEHVSTLSKEIEGGIEEGLKQTEELFKGVTDKVGAESKVIESKIKEETGKIENNFQQLKNDFIENSGDVLEEIKEAKKSVEESIFSAKDVVANIVDYKETDNKLVEKDIRDETNNILEPYKDIANVGGVTPKEDLKKSEKKTCDKESILEKAGDILEQSEKTISSVFGSIGDAARSTIQHFIPEEVDSDKKEMVDDFVHKLEKEDLPDEQQPEPILEKSIPTTEHSVSESTPQPDEKHFDTNDKNKIAPKETDGLTVKHETSGIDVKESAVDLRTPSPSPSGKSTPDDKNLKPSCNKDNEEQSQEDIYTEIKGKDESVVEGDKTSFAQSDPKDDKIHETVEEIKETMDDHKDKEELPSSGRRESIIEAAEEFLEKSERAVGSVFSAIGDAAKSVLHDILPEHKDKSDGKNVESDTKKDKDNKGIEEIDNKEQDTQVVKKVKEESDLAMSKVGVDFQIDQDTLRNEEKQIDDKVDMLQKSYDGLCKLTESASFDKCKPNEEQPTEKKEHDTPVVKTLEEESNLTKSDVGVDFKIDQDTLRNEEKQIDDKVDMIQKSYDGLCELTESASFDKCQPNKDLKIDKETIQKEEHRKEQEIEKEEHDTPVVKTLKEESDLTESNVGVDFKIDQETLRNEEKQIDDKVEMLQKSYDGLCELTESASFDKCKPNEEQHTEKEEHDIHVVKTLKEESNLTKSNVELDFKIDQDTLRNEEKQIDDKVDMLQKSYDGLFKLTESASFDKCKPNEDLKIDKETIKKEEHRKEQEIENEEHDTHVVKTVKEESDLTKSNVVDQETLRNEEKQIDDKVDMLQKSYDGLFKLTESASFDKCKPNEDSKIDKETIKKEEHREEQKMEKEEHDTHVVKTLKEESDLTKSNVVDQETLRNEEKQIDDKVDMLQKSYDGLFKLTESASFDKCKPNEDSKIDKETIKKEEHREEQKMEKEEHDTHVVKTLKKESELTKSNVEVDFKVDQETLRNEEKQIDDKVDMLQKSYDGLCELTESASFDKCQPNKDLNIDKETIQRGEHRKEQEKEEHDTPVVKTLKEESDLTKSNVGVDFKIDQDPLRSEEKQIDDKVDMLQKSYDGLFKLTESASFDKCKPNEDPKIDKETIQKHEHREEQKIEKEEHDTHVVKTLKEESDLTKSNVGVDFKVDQDTLRNEEKQIDDKVDMLQKSYDGLFKLTESASFDKCKPNEDSKIDKDTIQKQDKHIDEIVEQVEKSYEDQRKHSDQIIPENTTLEKEEKYIEDHVSNSQKAFDDVKDLLTSTQAEDEVRVEKVGEQVSHVELSSNLMEEFPDLTKSVLDQAISHTETAGEFDKIETKCDISKDAKTEERRVPGKEKQEIVDKLGTTLDHHFDMTKSTYGNDQDYQSDGTDELKAKDSVEVDEFISSQSEKGKENLEELFSLKPEPSEAKKLSISDVEITIKTEDCPKNATQMFLESERVGLTDITDAKVFVNPVDIKPETDQAGSSSISGLNVAMETTTLSDKSSSDFDLSGKTTPPTVPVSPCGKDVKSPPSKLDSGLSEQTETDDEDLSTKSQVAFSQSDLDETDMKMDPMSTSFYGSLHEEKNLAPTYLYEITKAKYSGDLADEEEGEEKTGEIDLMTASFIGELPSSLSSHEAPNSSGSKDVQSQETVGFPEPTYLYEVTKAKYSKTDLMTSSFIGDLPSSSQEERGSRVHDNVDPMTASVYFDPSDTDYDPIASWGKPLGLPSPAPPNNNEKGTPKKEKKVPAYVSAKNKLNDDKKRSESPSKLRQKKVNPVYVDLTYVPHHGNHYYSYVDFFKRIRARYYVFSGLEPSRQVYEALLEAKQTWEDNSLEVTIIPTYDTDILGYWVAENEELLTKFKIDLSPSASRCTINLQDHETSCSAYRLEF